MATMSKIAMNARMRDVTLGAMVIALLLGGAAALFAQQAPAGPGGARGRPGRFGVPGFAAGFALGQLDLGDAQKQQIRDIAQRHREQTRGLAERMQQAMGAQRAAIEKVPVNEALVRSAVQDLAAVEADMAVEQARLHSDIFLVLTIEQQEKAKQLEAQGQARARERRQRGQRQPKGQV